MNFDKLTGAQTVEIVLLQPELASNCRWEKLSSLDWVNLLKEQPALETYCPWNKFNNIDWFNMLSQCPQFIDKCDTSILDVWDKTRIVQSQPSLKHILLIK